jgi:hypothetical protein
MCDPCGVCGQKATVWILNPDIRSEHMLICVNCGKTAGVYCEKHEVPHQGFDDGSTACLMCINEEVRDGIGRREEIAEFIRTGLPPEEFEEIQEMTEATGVICCCDWQTALLRLLVCKAQRNREELLITVSNLIEEGTAAFLLS